MRVIVTRPAAQSTEWVELLRQQAIDAVALPLIGIAPVDDPAALHAAWHALARHRLVVFVSPNAAELFFAQRPADAAWPPTVWAGSPGPGTTRVLARLGVPAGLLIEPAGDAPQFDSESLWAQLRGVDWRGAEVLIVRGDGGREWLAEVLREAGAHIVHVAAYRRVAPTLDAAQRRVIDIATAQAEAHLWFFSSSEAIDNLMTLTQAHADTDWQRATALATHPRIAERARSAGFARVVETRPSLPAVVACIQSMRP